MKFQPFAHKQNPKSYKKKSSHGSSLKAIKAIKVSSCYLLLVLTSPYHSQTLFASSFLQGAHSNTAIRRHYYDATTLNHAQAMVASLRQQHRHRHQQQQQQQQQITNPTFVPGHSRQFKSAHAVNTSTQLYGFFNRFGRKSNHDDDDNDNDKNNNRNNKDDEEDNEHDATNINSTNDHDDHDDHETQIEKSVHCNDEHEENEEEENDMEANLSTTMTMSSKDLEQARQSFENLFSIPNDNQKQSKKKKNSTTTTPTTAFTPSSINNSSNNNNNNNNSDEEERNGNTNNNDESNNEQQEILLQTRDITLVSSAIPQPPLTAIARERRLKEISLISSLAQSDDPVNELWALWIAEKGPIAATLLLRAEQLMSVESYEEAETILWSLIHQYGIHWAEPVNRLATLKYMQGRLEESKTLCEVVLQTKPWHFGALSGIVLVCTAMNDATNARMWAEKRLPPFAPDHTSGDRRNVWISHAIEDAKRTLNEASKAGRNMDIGQEEIEFRTFRTKMQQLYLEDDNCDVENSIGCDDSFTSMFDDNNPDAWQ